MISRDNILGDVKLRTATSLLDEGAALAAGCALGSTPFHIAQNVQTEAEYKRKMAAARQIMQHAHIGLRDPKQTQNAMQEIISRCVDHGTKVDRFGFALDWAMGYPADIRKNGPIGTGLMLTGADAFKQITNATVAASHFGDFMLGFPGCIDTVKWAIQAGASTIGNLGQYFTFRLPDWDDDIADTEATMIALGLIAAHPAEIIVHSNLDDGFAAAFTDLGSSYGMVLIERYIIEELVGAKLTHCFGHHFHEPLERIAFHHALNKGRDPIGSMIYGATVLYRGHGPSDEIANYASLASYLSADIAALNMLPSGHAVTPIPVTEHHRIPDAQEIANAQIYASRLIRDNNDLCSLIDVSKIALKSDEIIQSGTAFAQKALIGLQQNGYNISDPAEMLLALRRIGPATLEKLYNTSDISMPSPIHKSILKRAGKFTKSSNKIDTDEIKQAKLTIAIASTDVHAHGKDLLAECLKSIGVKIIDCGCSAAPKDIIEASHHADMIAISSYNGNALEFQKKLIDTGLHKPILYGGRLNRVPDQTNTSLPIDIRTDLQNLGAITCDNIEQIIPALKKLIQ